MTRVAGATGPPSLQHLRHFVLLGALVAMEFALVFYGADWLTAQHTVRLRLYTAAELAIPLVPVMVIPYLTMYVIFGFAPFVLRSSAELNRFAAALASVIAIAGVTFLIVPAQLGFAAVNLSGTGWEPWFELASRLSGTYNLVPSLHVALFATAVFTYFSRVSARKRTLLVLWLFVVTASTVLTHRHHLLDVGTGLALGACGARAAARPRVVWRATAMVGQEASQ